MNHADADLNNRLKTLLRLDRECREVEEKRRIIEIQLEGLKLLWFDPLFSRRPKTWTELGCVIDRELRAAKIDYFDQHQRHLAQ